MRAADSRKMSFHDLYMNQNPLITNPNEMADVSAIVFGMPFDPTHSFRHGTRFGPDAVRLAFNNIKIFSNRFNIDLESVNIEDLGNTRHTVVASEIKNFIEKGKILVEDGKYEEALKLFENALELDPTDHGTWNQKGVALRSMGRYDEAIECFNKSLELVPKDLDAS